MSAIIRTVSVCDAVVAVEKMDLILSSASAWRCQYKEVLDVEDMLVPECGESFMMLMQTITGKHCFSAKDSLYNMNYIALKRVNTNFCENSPDLCAPIVLMASTSSGRLSGKRVLSCWRSLVCAPAWSYQRPWYKLPPCLASRQKDKS